MIGCSPAPCHATLHSRCRGDASAEAWPRVNAAASMPMSQSSAGSASGPARAVRPRLDGRRDGIASWRRRSDSGGHEARCGGDGTAADAHRHAHDDSTSRGRGSGVGSVGCFVRHWSPRCSTRWPDLHVLDRPLIAASGPGASRCLRFAHQVSTPPASSENCFSRSRGSADQVLLRRSIRSAITACCSCRSRRSTRAARCAGRVRQRRSRRIRLLRRGSST